MNSSKKGLSGTVAIIFIILITATAVTIIWTALIPGIKVNYSPPITLDNIDEACRGKGLIFTGERSSYNKYSFSCSDKYGIETLYSTEELKDDVSTLEDER